MRAASVVPSCNGIKVCSMTRTALGKVVTIFAIANSRAVFADQAQDQGIEAVGSGAGRDDHDQHEGIEDLGQIEPIVDPVCFIDRLVVFDALPSRRDDGDEDDHKEAKRGQRCEERDDDSAAGGELDCRHPPLVKAHGMNAESLEFVGKHAMALPVEELVVAREHEEHPDRDAVEGERDVGPSDTMEQYVHHRCGPFPCRYVGSGAATRVGSRGSLREECTRFYGKTKSQELRNNTGAKYLGQIPGPNAWARSISWTRRDGRRDREETEHQGARSALALSGPAI